MWRAVWPGCGFCWKNKKPPEGIEQLIRSSLFHFDRFRRTTLLGVPHIVPKLFRDVRRSRVVIQDDVGDPVFILVEHIRCGCAASSASYACILIYPRAHA